MNWSYVHRLEQKRLKGAQLLGLGKFIYFNAPVKQLPHTTCHMWDFLWHLLCAISV